MKLVIEILLVLIIFSNTELVWGFVVVYVDVLKEVMVLGLLMLMK